MTNSSPFLERRTWRRFTSRRIPPCAMSMASSSTVSLISPSELTMRTSWKVLGFFPEIVWVRSAFSLMQTTYLLFWVHLSGIAEMEVMGL